MNRDAELEEAYFHISDQIEDWLFEAEIPAWASGRASIEFFGQDANALDIICLLASYQRVLPMVIRVQVDQALQDGHSWTDIAAALGTSRQAASKRYGQRH
jgi:hypothetical protein